MNNPIQDQWRNVRFGQLAKKLVNGGTPPTDIAMFWNGSIPWVTGADFTTSGIGEFRRFVSIAALTNTATNAIEKGQLLVVTRTGVGKLAIAPCDIAISQDVTGVYVDRDQVTPNYLYYRMTSGLEELKKLNQGTSINGIVRSDLINYTIELPPLAQQQHIAEILSSIDDAIEQTESLIAKHQNVKSGLMHDLFTRGVTPDGRLRPTREQAPELYKESPWGWIPKEWLLEALVNFSNRRVGSFVNGPFGSDLLTSELKDSGVPVIYVQDIKQGEYIRASNANVSEDKANQLAVCNVRFGDVIVAKVGDPPGIAAVYEQSLRAVVTQDVIRIRPGEEVSSSFLANLLNSTIGRRAIQRIVIEGTRARVSLTEFKTLVLPKPHLEEQKRIAKILTSIQHDLRSLNVQLNKLLLQKRGLMHDLLTGRVRVKTTEAAVAPATP